jgi:hypothetical protein
MNLNRRRGARCKPLVALHAPLVAALLCEFRARSAFPPRACSAYRGAHSRCSRSARRRSVHFTRAGLMLSGRGSRQRPVGDPIPLHPTNVFPSSSRHHLFIPEQSCQHQLARTFVPYRIGTSTENTRRKGTISSILARAARTVSSSSSQVTAPTAIFARRNPGCAIHVNHIGNKCERLNRNIAPAQFDFLTFPPQRRATVIVAQPHSWLYSCAFPTMR